MSSSKIKREYPYFAKYLDSTVENQRVDRDLLIFSVGCMTAIAAGLAGGIAVALILNYMNATGFVSIISGAVSFPIWATIGGLLAPKFFKRRRKKADFTGEEQILLDAEESCRGLIQLDKDRKLHKWLDPVAGQLLEASALHWDRIRTILSGSSWHREDLGAHWVSIRDKSLRAADIAMAEITLLCARCVGEPAKNRSDDWKDILEDFAELDIEDGLRGLNKAIATDPKTYRFTSPETRVVFEPARQIAERLKLLADHVEQSAKESAMDLAMPHGSYATESIDALLGEFKSINLAETELDSGQHLGH